LNGISWVIVGGESGPKARPINADWVLSIRDQCKAANVPFFFKQWGGRHKKKAGRLLEGNTYDEFPVLVRGSVPARAICDNCIANIGIVPELAIL
jgi:protein gp37